jgi:hypothetical protein
VGDDGGHDRGEKFKIFHPGCPVHKDPSIYFTDGARRAGRRAPSFIELGCGATLFVEYEISDVFARMVLTNGKGYGMHYGIVICKVRGGERDAAD